MKCVMFFSFYTSFTRKSIDGKVVLKIFAIFFRNSDQYGFRETHLLNDVVRSRIQFGFLQGRRGERLHLSFVGDQLEFIVLFKRANLHTSVMTQILF